MRDTIKSQDDGDSMWLPCLYICWNQSVLSNSIKLLSVLKNKYFSVSYQFFHEVVSKEKGRTGYISTYNNTTDFLTNILVEDKRTRFAQMMLHHITSKLYGEWVGNYLKPILFCVLLWVLFIFSVYQIYEFTGNNGNPNLFGDWHEGSD